MLTSYVRGLSYSLARKSRRLRLLELILRELNVCDNLQDQEFWHQQNPKYERQFPNKNPHRILPVVDDKSVVVMIRYTTNIEAAAAKWVSSFHCKNCLKLPATPYVHTYLVYIENIGWSGELCWWSTWAFLRKFYMQNGSHHPIGKIP